MGDLSANFSRKEFRCPCGGCDFETVDAELINVLQDLRNYAQGAVTVDSGVRCQVHNASVGGSPTSRHLEGRAADIRVDGMSPTEVVDYLNARYPHKYGLGRYANFTHIDTRPQRVRWAF